MSVELLDDNLYVPLSDNFTHVALDSQRTNIDLFKDDKPYPEIRITNENTYLPGLEDIEDKQFANFLRSRVTREGNCRTNITSDVIKNVQSTSYQKGKDLLN